MIQRKRIVWVFTLGTILLLSACKTVAVLPTKTPVKKVDVASLASKIKGTYPKVDKLRSRIRAVYDDGKRAQQVIIQLRMQAQQKIWMSASMVIPIAKLLITKEGVSFMKNFKKTILKEILN
jgi:outer membrane murein-binding lipoprotein Lpp